MFSNTSIHIYLSWIGRKTAQKYISLCFNKQQRFDLTKITFIITEPEIEFVSEKEKRDNKTKRDVFRRHILSELKVPTRNAELDDNIIEEYPGKAKPFTHPSERQKEQSYDTNDEDSGSSSNRSSHGKFNKFQSIEETYLQRTFDNKYCDENGRKKGQIRSRYGMYIELHVASLTVQQKHKYRRGKTLTMSLRKGVEA